MRNKHAHGFVCTRFDAHSTGRSSNSIHAPSSVPFICHRAFSIQRSNSRRTCFGIDNDLPYLWLRYRLTHTCARERTCQFGTVEVEVFLYDSRVGWWSNRTNDNNKTPNFVIKFSFDLFPALRKNAPTAVGAGPMKLLRSETIFAQFQYRFLQFWWHAAIQSIYSCTDLKWKPY